MDEKLLTDLFTRAGLVDEGIEREPFMDRTKLYSLGLMGKDDSAEKRKKLAKKLGLYEELSTTSFLESLNLLCSEEEFFSAYNSLDED
jgi:ribonuclease M5